MNLKNLTALALTAALACAVAVPAFAENVDVTGDGTDTPQPKEATVTYQEANRWVVTIPTSIDMKNTDNTWPTQELTAVYSIEPTKQLNVQISGGVADSKVTLTRQSEKTGDAAVTITTAVTNGGAAVVVGENLATKTGTETASQSLCTLAYQKPVATAGGEIKAGTYSGTVTFKIFTSDLPKVSG